MPTGYASWRLTCRRPSQPRHASLLNTLKFGPQDISRPKNIRQASSFISSQKRRTKTLILWPNDNLHWTATTIGKIQLVTEGSTDMPKQTGELYEPTNSEMQRERHSEIYDNCNKKCKSGHQCQRRELCVLLVDSDNNNRVAERDPTPQAVTISNIPPYG